MVHSLTTTPAAAIPISSSSSKCKKTIIPAVPFLKSHGGWACKTSEPVSDSNVVHRRTATLGLASALLGLTVSDRSAKGARRPPPPPPEEKKDPNVSGVQAKVLASKKRKEAMKESIAKLRQKGKAINEESKPVTNEPSEQ